jgi:putative hydrolase of the HAD superfamily
MRIRAVLFDMFDTLMLVDRRKNYASPSLLRMYRFLSAHGVEVSFETFETAHNQAREELYAKADPKLEEPHFHIRIARTLNILGYAATPESSLVAAASAEFCDEFMKYVTPDADLSTLISELSGKYKLGIVSNFVLPDCVTRLLDREGVVDVFGAVIVSGAVNKRKPAPEIFRQALSKLGVTAQEAVFVGDTLDADVLGAKAVGMLSVYLARRVEKEISAKPDVIVKSLGELPIVLEQLQTGN